MNTEVYKADFLPSHMKKIEILKGFTEELVVDTKDTVSVVRVLKNDNRGLLRSVRRFLLEHKDPADCDELKKQQLHILEDQITDVRSKSRERIHNIAQRR